MLTKRNVNLPCSRLKRGVESVLEKEENKRSLYNRESWGRPVADRRLRLNYFYAGLA